MAILILTSAGGSPGVTTLAIGLALTWPRPVLLADCDPGAHQAVLAGYLRGQSSSGKGLLRVAEAHRDRRPLREVVIDQCLPLTGEDGDRRLFLPGCTKPGSASLFGAVWEDLAVTFVRLGPGRVALSGADELCASPRAVTLDFTVRGRSVTVDHATSQGCILSPDWTKDLVGTRLEIQSLPPGL